MIANNADNSSPVLSSEFDEWMSCIGYFEPNPTITIATSGGADSMALLLLAKNWVRDRNGKLISLTINHNLRPEAADEAFQVEQWCKKHDIEHHTLYWQHASTPLSAIQENARNARYELMVEWCVKNNILHLLTAHHRDDQAETLFFRLARGSGLEGLACMSAQTVISGVRLLRPLLQVPKSQLTATLEVAGQKWLEDSSNQNPLYTRIYIRKQLTKAPNEIVIKQTASHITDKFGNFRNLLENKLVSQMTKAVEIYPEGYGIINHNDFSHLDKEISIKALGALIRTISGAEHPPRKENLVYLNQLICNDQLNSKRSLGGLFFEKISKTQTFVYREPRAIENPIFIQSNTPTIWDKRFLVEWSSDTPSPPTIELRALGSDGLAQIKKNASHLLNNIPPARIIRTIPSIWILEELVSAPHISYMNSNYIFLNIKLYTQFHPAKPLADSGFFVMNNQV